MCMPIARRMARKGARAQAIGPSWGGQTTKVHVLTDVLGRPAVIHLTPGNASDVRAAPDVLAQAPGRTRRLPADRGHDSNVLRAALRSGGTSSIIPGRRCRKWPICHDTRRLTTATQNAAISDVVLDCLIRPTCRWSHHRLTH